MDVIGLRQRIGNIEFEGERQVLIYACQHGFVASLQMTTKPMMHCAMGKIARDRI